MNEDVTASRLEDRSPALRAQVDWCPICCVETTFEHDHRADNSGLDDGPPITPVRRKPAPKSAEEMKTIRAAAWATRRAMYGERGHK